MSINLISNGRLSSDSLLETNPRSTVYHADVISFKFFNDDERYTCPTAKDQKVYRKCHVRVFQLYLCNGGKLVQCQELTFLVVWVNVVHGKWISRYLAVVVSCRYNMLQWYGVNPNGGLRKSDDILQIQAIVTDEFLSKLVHGHIAALVLILDEIGNILFYRQILAVGVSWLYPCPHAWQKLRSPCQRL